MDWSTEYYAKIGRQTVKFGLEMANDILVNVIRELGSIDNTIPVKRGRPRKTVTAAAASEAITAPPEATMPPAPPGGPGSYWAKMTAEERSMEMKRRMRNRKRMDPAAVAAFSAKMRKITKASWKKRRANAALLNGHAAAVPTVRERRQQA